MVLTVPSSLHPLGPEGTGEVGKSWGAGQSSQVHYSGTACFGAGTQMEGGPPLGVWTGKVVPGAAPSWATCSQCVPTLFGVVVMARAWIIVLVQNLSGEGPIRTSAGTSSYSWGKPEFSNGILALWRCADRANQDRANQLEAASLPHTHHPRALQPLQ